MAHRIAKKQIKTQIDTTQPQSKSETTAYYEHHPPAQSKTTKLPRPILTPTDSIYRHDKASFRKNMLAFPPPQSLFVSQNNYDAGPDFIRPTSAMMLGNPKKTGFPFGALINPFGSDRVHTVRVKSPLRCRRCNAYVNPYFRLDGSKTSATCNICGTTCQVAGTTDPANLNSHEIFTEGVIDFVVQDKIYLKKRLDLIKVIIAIEMGHFMSETESFSTIIQSVKSAIENTEFQKCIRIGIIYFNAEGTTYLKLNKSAENWQDKKPKRYTVKNGSTNLCCPLSDHEMLFDPNTEKQQLGYILDCVQSISQDFYKNSKFASHGASYPAAIKTLMQNFQKQSGRIMLFASTTPRAGPLGIRPKNEDDAKLPLKPLSDHYYEMAKDLRKSKIGVDMYLFSKENLASHEIATVHYLSSLTGGSVQLYSPYHPQLHSQNLYYNVYSSLTRKYVYDVDFTARVSTGLNISAFGVGDGLHETRDVSLGMMDPANAISVHFEHEQKIEESSNAYLQYAMMFTTGSGERRVRIINYRYQITNKIELLHEAADYLAFSNLILRLAINKLPKTDSAKVREDLVNRLILILSQLAQENSMRASSSFLAHPNLAPAFAYIHSFINSKVILNHLKTSTDFRMRELLNLNTFNFTRYSNYFYPKIFSLGMEIYEEEPAPGQPIEGDEDIEQSAVLPVSLSLGFDSIKKDGVYLRWGEDCIVILVQAQAPEELLQQIFGTTNWEQIEENGVPELETAHNIRINIILEELRRRTSRGHGIFLPVIVKTPKKKGPYQEYLQSLLKEEYQECKYFSFLDSIHRHAQTRLK